MAEAAPVHETESLLARLPARLKNNEVFFLLSCERNGPPGGRAALYLCYAMCQRQRRGMRRSIICVCEVRERGWWENFVLYHLCGILFGRSSSAQSTEPFFLAFSLLSYPSACWCGQVACVASRPRFRLLCLRGSRPRHGRPRSDQQEAGHVGPFAGRDRGEGFTRSVVR